MSNMTLVPAKPVADQAHAPKPDTMKLRHLIESQQLTVPLLMELFNRSRGMERVVARGGTLDYQNRILATMFYRPSTRTRRAIVQKGPEFSGGLVVQYMLRSER